MLPYWSIVPEKILIEVALRRMVVTDPIKVVITNYPEDKTEILHAQNNPEDENGGQRHITFGREIFYRTK